MTVQHVLAPRPPASSEKDEAEKLAHEQAAEEARRAAEAMPPPPPQNMNTLRDHILAAQAGYPARYTSPTPSFAPQWDPSQLEGSGLGSASVDINDDVLSLDGRKRSVHRELSHTKRAAQNRAAQRAFRERKEQYIKQLEIKARESDEHRIRCAQLVTKVKALQDLLNSYRSILIERSIEHEEPAAFLLREEQPPASTPAPEPSMKRTNSSMAPPPIPTSKFSSSGPVYSQQANPYERVVDMHGTNSSSRPSYAPSESTYASSRDSSRDPENATPSQDRRPSDVTDVMPSTESDPAQAPSSQSRRSSVSTQVQHKSHSRSPRAASDSRSAVIDPDLHPETGTRKLPTPDVESYPRPTKRRRSGTESRTSASPHPSAPS